MSEEDQRRLRQALDLLQRAQRWFGPTHPLWQEIEAFRVLTEEYLQVLEAARPWMEEKE